MDSKVQDALVIIELYKLRCEPLMRTARAWFVSEFAPQSGRDIVKLMLSGQEHSAYYRMVASYWESTASLVNNGGVDETLFLDANTEHVIVFAKLQPFIEEIRRTRLPFASRTVSVEGAEHRKEVGKPEKPS